MTSEPTRHAVTSPQLTAAGVQDPPARKWIMLALITTGFIAMAVNWFNISTGFDAIADEFDADIVAVALLISMFVVAYGLLHVPGGFLATRWGLRNALVLGIGLEGIGSILSALAGSYPLLMICRVVAGAGASVFAAVGIAGVTAWFRDRYHAMALGVSSAGFSAGTALGLYGWAALTAATGWRWSVALGGIFALLVALAFALAFRVPVGADVLRGVVISRSGVLHTLRNRQVWLFGFAFIGAYGAYIAGSQLISGFGEDREISSAQIAAAAFLIGIAGVPGSIVGGLLADRYFDAKRLFVVGAVLEGAFLISVPLLPGYLFWLSAAGVGFMFNFTFAVVQTIPGDTPSISPEHLGTAVGLMLTISAVGGFVLPYFYGRLASSLSASSGWLFLGLSAVALGLVGLLSPLIGRRGVETKRDAAAALT